MYSTLILCNKQSIRCGHNCKDDLAFKEKHWTFDLAERVIKLTPSPFNKKLCRMHSVVLTLVQIAPVEACHCKLKHID